MRLATGTAVLLLLVAPRLRADVLIVHPHTPGAYGSVAAAVAAAVDGDLILLSNLPPTESKTTLFLGDKSLTLVGQDTFYKWNDVDRVVVQGLSAGKVLVVRNLTLDRGLELVGNQGAVRFEECDIWGLAEWPGTFDEPAVSVTGCADAAFARCDLRGGHGTNHAAIWDNPPSDGSDGLVSESSLVTLTQCILRGGDGGWSVDGSYNGADGGHGARNVGGTLAVVGGTLTGGDGGSGSCSIWCGHGGAGGHALLTDADGSAAFLRGVEPQGGVGGVGYGAPNGPDGLGIKSGLGPLTIWEEPATDLWIPSPLREADVFSISFVGQVGDVNWLLMGAEPLQALAPAAQGVLLVEAPMLVSFPGVIQPDGQLHVPMHAPQLPAGLEEFDAQLQSLVQRDGSWLLGAPTVVTLVDESL